jgi:hypothetical protein
VQQNDIGDRSMADEMMTRLSPFFPAMVVFVGAVVVAAGGFWASWNQSKFNTEIREKNEEIARLQLESANAITGGDSFAWVAFQIFGADGTAVNAYSMPDDLLLVPNFIHQGKYPLYDVSVRFADVAPDRPLDVISAMGSYSVGNLALGSLQRQASDWPTMERTSHSTFSSPLEMAPGLNS